MESLYLTLKEAAALGKYSEKSLRRAMENGDYVKGYHYINRGGKPGGKILFHRDRYIKALEGVEDMASIRFIKALEGVEDMDPMEFAKKRRAS